MTKKKKPGSAGRRSEAKQTPSKKSSSKAASKKSSSKKPAPKKPLTDSPRNPKPISEAGDDDWTFRLYLAGDTPKSVAARRNLQRLCEEHLPGRCHIEIIDLVEHPELARADQILAIPTLVRKIPVPIKRIIGDLSNEERAMLALDLRKR